MPRIKPVALNRENCVLFLIYISRTAGVGAAVVTLIEMSDTASVLLNRAEINDALLTYIKCAYLLTSRLS